jgi:hypothetical protein
MSLQWIGNCICFCAEVKGWEKSYPVGSVRSNCSVAYLSIASRFSIDWKYLKHDQLDRTSQWCYCLGNMVLGMSYFIFIKLKLKLYTYITAANDSVTPCCRYFMLSTCLVQATFIQLNGNIWSIQNFSGPIKWAHLILSTHLQSEHEVEPIVTCKLLTLQTVQQFSCRHAHCITILGRTKFDTFHCSGLQFYFVWFTKYVILTPSCSFLDFLQHVQINQVIICVDRVKQDNTRNLTNCSCQIQVFTDPDC